MKDIPEIVDLMQRYPCLEVCRADIAAACGLLTGCFRRGNKLLVCGNGGSAADADHIVGELMKGFMKRRPLRPEQAEALKKHHPEDGAFMAERLQEALPAISLSAHTSLVTAAANDIAPELIFAQQVLGYGVPGDLLMAISTSGNSANTLYAAAAAEALGLTAVALTGKDGGNLAERCTAAIRVPAEGTPEIQELHLPVYHTLCRAVESSLFTE